MIDGKKVPKRVKFVYKDADDYKVIYVNGAQGGITTQREFKFDLYQEYIERPSEEIRTIDGIKISDPIKSESEGEEMTVVRERKIGVTFSPDKARSLADWIIRQLDEMEKGRGEFEKMVEEQDAKDRAAED